MTKQYFLLNSHSWLQAKHSALVVKQSTIRLTGPGLKGVIVRNCHRRVSFVLVTVKTDTIFRILVRRIFLRKLENTWIN